MNKHAVTAIVLAAVASTMAEAQNYTFSTLVELRLVLPSGGIVPYLAGVAADGVGNVYAVQADRHAVLKFTPPRELSLFAGAPFTAGFADGAATDARFMARRFGTLGIATDSAGNVFVADEGNCTIRKITPDGEVTTLAGKAGMPGDEDGIGDQARFRRPASLCVHVDGDLYVVDRIAETVRRITPQGAVSTLAKVSGWLSGIAVDRQRNVFVTCYDDAVRKISPTGEVTIFAGRPRLSGSRDGTGGDAGFSFSDVWWDDTPLGIAPDRYDNLFVVDPGNHCIRRITPEANVTTVLPGPNLSWPSSIAVDRAGNLYVTDSFLDSKIIKGTVQSTLNVIATPQSRTVAIGSTVVFTLEANGAGFELLRIARPRSCASTTAAR